MQDYTSPLYDPNDKGIENLGKHETDESQEQLGEAGPENNQDNKNGGEKDPNDTRNTGYSDTQLDGHNVNDPEYALTRAEDDQHLIKDEETMSEKVIGDAEMDSTQLGIEDVADTQNSRFGIATAAAAFATLETVAADIVSTGALKENDENPSQEDLCTQGNNLCKAATIYAISAHEKYQLAVQKLPFDVVSAQIYLNDITMLEENTARAAAAATEQAGRINDYRLADHIANRATQARELATAAKTSLEQAIQQTVASQEEMEELKKKAADAQAEDVLTDIFQQSEQEAESNGTTQDPEQITQEIEGKLDKYIETVPPANPEIGIMAGAIDTNNTLPPAEAYNDEVDFSDSVFSLSDDVLTPQSTAGDSAADMAANSLETAAYNPESENQQPNGEQA